MKQGMFRKDFVIFDFNDKDKEFIFMFYEFQKGRKEIELAKTVFHIIK